MKKLSFSLGVLTLFISTSLFAAVNDQAIVNELTGKKEASVQNLKNAPLSVRHYHAGRAAAAQKNYIVAIKHFNTVIKNYPKTREARAALLAKAQVYQEMGLRDQALRNLQLARGTKAAPAVSRTASSATAVEKNKSTK